MGQTLGPSVELAPCGVVTPGRDAQLTRNARSEETLLLLPLRRT